MFRQVTFRKRPFETGRTTDHEVSIHRCLIVPALSWAGFTSANLNNYFKLTNKIKEKSHLKAKKLTFASFCRRKQANSLYGKSCQQAGRTKKEALTQKLNQGFIIEKWRPPTLPHCIAVPSAQAGLTSLFGMGRGGTPPQ